MFRRRKIWSILALACILLSLPLGALAENAAISVRWAPDGKNAVNAEFQLYHVAEIQDDGSSVLTEGFAEFDGNIDETDQRSLAITLAAYAAGNGLSVDQNARTGQDGTAAFAGLAPGIYLLTGSAYETSGKTYMPQPSLIRLAGNANVEVKPKYDAEDQKTISLRVVKRWDDDSEQRPDHVTVQLIGNGEVVDSVRLDRENGWEHTWESLDAGIRWQVAENPVPEGYSANIDRKGNTFVITNTKPADETPGSRLPQTGSMMWPVPVLASGGMLLFLLGWLRRRRK